MCELEKKSFVESSLTFPMLAIKLLVNPPCQHTQQRDDNDGAENGTHYTATAVALH